MATHDSGCAGDGVGLVRVDGLYAPGHLAALGVQGNQTAVQGADEDLVAPGGDAPVDDVAANLPRHRPGNLGVVAPEKPAAGTIDGVDHAPGSREVEDAVHRQGRGLEAASSAEIQRPGEAEIVDIVRPDSRQGTVALFGVASTVGQPIAGLIVWAHEALVIDAGRLRQGCVERHA